MRMLSDKERFEILSLKPDDITQKKLVELFAATNKGESKYEPNDRFILETNHKVYNKSPIETTVGRYIFNMFCLPESYLKKYGYCNTILSGGGLSKEETRMTDMTLTQEMKPEDFLIYMRKAEWMSGAMVAYLSPSFDLATVDNIPEVMTMKENLNREYADKIAEGDKNVLSMINDKLVDAANSIMKGNPEKYKTIEWANAGVYGISKNYRKTNISTGLQRKPSNQNDYFYVDSNYADGLSKKDYANNSNLAIIGGLSRGLDSAESGYSSKKILGAMSTWSLDKDLEDCGTPHFLEIEIPKGYEQSYYYRWIKEGDNFVLLNADNIQKYVGKKVKMRSPLYCLSDKVCKKCAGDFMGRVGIDYEGLAAFEIADVLVNAMMKAFHDSSITSSHIDPEKYIKKIS
jgi:hypothetical protein